MPAKAGCPAAVDFSAGLWPASYPEPGGFTAGRWDGQAARAYLAALGLPDPDADPETAALIWMHTLPTAPQVSGPKRIDAGQETPA